MYNEYLIYSFLRFVLFVRISFLYIGRRRDIITISRFNQRQKCTRRCQRKTITATAKINCTQQQKQIEHDNNNRAAKSSTIQTIESVSYTISHKYTHTQSVSEHTHKRTKSNRFENREQSQRQTNFELAKTRNVISYASYSNCTIHSDAIRLLVRK